MLTVVFKLKLSFKLVCWSWLTDIVLNIIDSIKDLRDFSRESYFMSPFYNF